MLINYIHLLIFFLLINLSTCNWLRLGLSGIELPDQNYIEQFNFNKHHSLRNRYQFKKMHHSNDTHQHRFDNKLNNLTIITKFLSNNSNNIFFNDFTNLNIIKKYKQYDLLLNQLNDGQLKFIKKNPNSLNILSLGANLAIEECALRFEKEKWNCSIEDENEVFGQTLKRANKESAYIQSLVTAATVYSFTKACSTGNLANCGCDYKYEKYSDIQLNKNQDQRSWFWAGCSDNLDFGIKLAKQFLNTESLKTTKTKIVTKNRAASLREYMNSHNSNVGINSVKKLMRLKCKCHGSSGSCAIRTCWKVLPKFNEIGKYLKKKYRQSVHIEGIINQGTNFKLKRSRRDLTTSNLLIKNRLKKTKDNTINSKTISDTSKLKSIYYNELPDIELNSNSFIVNKVNHVNEKEIDEDEDYDEEKDYVENKNDKIELEKNKLLINKNQFFNSDKNSNKILNIKSSSLSSMNKQQNIINKQINKIDLEFENLIPNVHKPLNSLLTIKPNIKLINKPYRKSSSQKLTMKEHHNKQSETSKLKANNQSSKWFTPNKSDLIFIHKSPNYCNANNEMNILGTHNRTCRNLKNNKDNYSDSCELLCCGRGYNRKMIHKSERCNCEFDIVSVDVKCKTCQYTVELNTCK